MCRSLKPRPNLLKCHSSPQRIYHHNTSRVRKHFHSWAHLFSPYSHLISQKHGCLEGRCVILGSVCPSASVSMDGDFSGLTKVQSLLIFRSRDQIEGSSYLVLANVSKTHQTHHLHLFSLPFTWYRSSESSFRHPAGDD